MRLNMKYSLHLDDLPVEILMMIFKKLDNAEVLYSLIGVNKRLNTIANDSIFTKYITLMASSSNRSWCSYSDTILERFCSQILPRIHHEVHWLNLELSSMERILRLTDYPNLHGLGLYELTRRTARNLFTDQSFLIRNFKNQISSLVIDIVKYDDWSSSQDINIFICTQIFTLFKNLQCLKFGVSLCGYTKLSFTAPPPAVFSSALLELHVYLQCYDDCLYLLDGRFHQLHTFGVTVCCTNPPSATMMDNKMKLPNLKCFSFTIYSMGNIFDSFLVPVLRRMPNLEELRLHFSNNSERLIDGVELKKNILHHMTKLNKFIFNIQSVIRFHNQTNLPSNENIQDNLRDFKGNQIISCVDCLPEAKEYRCHIYSYPYTSIFYENITNNFPGGLFRCVIEISLYDERPFEHKFFFQIAQSFPLLEKLTLKNYQPQRNDNQEWTIIEFPHLNDLNITDVHESYLEQFLISTKTYLPNDVFLRATYESLQSVTHNFTRSVTRINCSKVTTLFLLNEPESFQHRKDYFPNA